MKMTIELPEDLVSKVRTVAIQRKVSLNRFIQEVLLHEVAVSKEPHARTPEKDFCCGPYGILSLKKRGAEITSEKVYKLLERSESLED